ncbi:MAG TPA: ATP-binding protein, partial [Luteimonas sp.]
MRLRQRIPLSLQFGALALLYLLAGAALSVVLSQWLAPVWAAFAATALMAPLLLYHARQLFAPMNALFRALAGSVASYRDGDFGFGVTWDGRDELGELVASHNALGDVLREQRLGLVQRELLLDTMVQNTPVVMVLVDPAHRVVLANLAAR